MLKDSARLMPVAVALSQVEEVVGAPGTAPGESLMRGGFIRACCQVCQGEDSGCGGLPRLQEIQVAQNLVVIYKFGKWDVRMVYDASGEPLFVASDVCAALGVQNPSDAIKRLDDDEKGVDSIDTLGGQQDVTVVNESGLYSLILGSRKPQSKAFKRWVTHEVLPTIRRTGSYTAKQSTPVAQSISTDWIAQSALNAQALVDTVIGLLGQEETNRLLPGGISVPDVAMGLAGMIMQRQRFLLEFEDLQNPTMRRLHTKEVVLDMRAADWADKMMSRLTREQVAQLMHAAARRMA